MKDKIISETPMNLAEVKDEIEKIKKRDKELNFRAQKTIDYLNQIVSLKSKQAEELAKKLDNLKIPRLKDLHIQKIISVMPASESEVKVLLQGYTITITKENMKKIADNVKEFLPEKK